MQFQIMKTIKQINNFSPDWKRNYYFASNDHERKQYLWEKGTFKRLFLQVTS